MTMEPIKLNTPSHLENHFSFNGLDIVKITKLKTSTVIGICEDELLEPIGKERQFKETLS